MTETSTEIALEIILGSPELRKEVSDICNDGYNAPELVGPMVSHALMEFVEDNKVERARDASGLGKVHFATIVDVFTRHEDAGR